MVIKQSKQWHHPLFLTCRTTSLSSKNIDERLGASRLYAAMWLAPVATAHVAAGNVQLKTGCNAKKTSRFVASWPGNLKRHGSQSICHTYIDSDIQTTVAQTRVLSFELHGQSTLRGFQPENHPTHQHGGRQCGIATGMFVRSVGS